VRVREVVGMPDIFSIITHGKMRQNAIDSQKEFEAKKSGKLVGVRSSPEADALLERFPSKAIKLPTDHIDYVAEHNGSIQDFIVKHKEVGIKAVISHVLDNGTKLPAPHKEQIVDFFVDNYKKKIDYSPTVVDFYHCFTEASVGNIVKTHLNELPADDPKRSVISSIAYHPEEYVEAIRKTLVFYPSLRGLIPQVPKK